MFSIILKLRQKFCRHRYLREYINGYRVIDGALVRAQKYTCVKCGKISYKIERN